VTIQYSVWFDDLSLCSDSINLLSIRLLLKMTEKQLTKGIDVVLYIL